MRSLLTANALVLPESVVNDAWLLIEDGVVHSFGTRGDGLPQHTEHHELPGALLAPAMLDIHVHGAANHDVMEGTAEGVSHVSRFLAARGVGAFLPTTVTASVDDTLRALEGLATLIEAPGSIEGAAPLGVHLEGPFISHAKRGVHPPSLLQPPSIELFDRFWQASRGTIRLMTVAPELPHALDLIQHATALGVRISLGHSDATAAETQAGVTAGGVSATHTYNAMRGLDHREPGMLGAVLDDGSLYAEIIADGIHVQPIAIRIYWRCKGSSRAILITDGMSATGMPNGRYRLGSIDVDVADGRATAAGSPGVLAGSVLTMDRAVHNFAAFTGAPLATVTRLATANPAALAGFAQTHGVIAAGRRADIIAFSEEGQLVATCIAGCFARVQ
ncbi:MAG TPA: N-acetylglucosamine-6-phosphate deacetylase [Acidobacteriaceae bacterium]|nr:N-acetylglucosamine-6-phosphate deacetylase [Acidobacteriaceae bacterium]